MATGRVLTPKEEAYARKQEKLAKAQQQQEGVVTDNNTQQQGGVLTVDNNQQQQTVAQNNPYLVDWSSSITPRDVYNEGKHSQYDIIRDHVRWANENGKSINTLDYMFAPDDDPNKSKKDNEKEAKNKQRAEMFEGIGNVLTSIAQFAGAAAGAPAISNPTDYRGLTERQRRLKDETLAKRRAYNKDLFAAMKQQQADEYNRNKLKLEQQKQNRLDEQQRLRDRELDWKIKYQQGLLDDKAEMRRIREEYNKGQMSYHEMMSSAAMLNAMTHKRAEDRLSGGSTTEVKKADGSVETKIVTPNSNKKNQQKPSGGTTTKPGRKVIDY